MVLLQYSKQPLDPLGESVTPEQVLGYTPHMNRAAQEPAEEFGGEDDLITEHGCNRGPGCKCGPQEMWTLKMAVMAVMAVMMRDDDDDDLYTIRIE